MKAHAKRLLRPLRPPLLRAARAVLRRPRLRALAIVVLDGVPQLRTLLRRAMRGSHWQPPRRAHMPRNVADLSPATQAAYRDLVDAFERHRS